MKAILGILKILFIKNKQFIKFGFVGLSNTIISLLIYYILIYFRIHYQIANVTAFILSSLNGFLWNKRWVFRANDAALLSQLLKYYTVYCSSLLISLGLAFLWIDILGIDKYVAPLISLSVTIPYNYIFNKIWAFKNTPLTGNA